MKDLLRTAKLQHIWGVVGILVGIVVFASPVEEGVLQLLQGPPAVGPEEAIQLGAVFGITLPMTVVTMGVVAAYLGKPDPTNIEGGELLGVAVAYFIAALIAGASAGIPPEDIAFAVNQTPGNPIAKLAVTAFAVFNAVYSVQLVVGGLLVGIAGGATIHRLSVTS